MSGPFPWCWNVLLETLKMDFLPCIQDVESAILEDVRYFVRTSLGSDELASSSFRDDVTKDPYSVADAMRSCLDMAIKLLFFF